MPIPSSGGALYRGGATAIRLAHKGCANRPFFHIVVQNSRDDRDAQPIEQVGTFDPIPNEANQKLVSVNLERVQYWIGRGARVSSPVAQLLGLMGFLHIHPKTHLIAWENRKAAAEKAAAALKKAETESASLQAPSSSAES